MDISADSSESRRSEGFGRSQRLLKPAEFKRVFAEGRRIGNRHLTLVVAENGLGHARLGLAISKRQIKTAVARNRVKRQLRERFRREQQVITGVDIVAMARTSAATSDKVKLRQAVAHLWRELTALCEKS